MRVTILGTRGNVRASASRHARHSGILVDGKLLLDLGEGFYLDYRSRHTFITHLHPYHAEFASTVDMTPGVKIDVPEASTKMPNAQVIARPVRTGSYKDIAASIRGIESLGDGVRVPAAYDGLTFEI